MRHAHLQALVQLGLMTGCDKTRKREVCALVTCALELRHFCAFNMRKSRKIMTTFRSRSNFSPRSSRKRRRQFQPNLKKEIKSKFRPRRPFRSLRKRPLVSGGKLRIGRKRKKFRKDNQRDTRTDCFKGLENFLFECWTFVQSAGQQRGLKSNKIRLSMESSQLEQGQFCSNI